MIDFATFEPPSSPNTYLVCDVEACAAASDRPSVEFDQSATTVAAAWLSMIAEQPRTVQTDQDEANLQYEFVQRSALFRFPDIITVRFVPLDEATSKVIVFSQSKYGHSDMGVNKKRVDSWLAETARKLNN